MYGQYPVQLERCQVLIPLERAPRALQPQAFMTTAEGMGFKGVAKYDTLDRKTARSLDRHQSVPALA